MKISIIISWYKDIRGLELILLSLKNQSYKNFEVIVAEDDNSKETLDFLQSFKGLDIKHVSHEDFKRKKPIIQNKAILASSGDYLIFIDGDCIPYRHFVKSHLFLAQKNRVLVGRRVGLGEKISQDIRKKRLSIETLERRYLLFFLAMKKDKTLDIEQGIYWNPNGLIFKLLQKRKGNFSLLGCNFSCYRKDMFTINGFDETYVNDSIADDTDIQWRFEAIGLKMKSCKFAANTFHLHHFREYKNTTEQAPELKLMLKRKQKGIYKAAKGLDSYKNIK